jgi:hypothetical protein
MALFSFLSGLWNALTDIFRQIWDVLKWVIVIVLLVLAVMVGLGVVVIPAFSVFGFSFAAITMSGWIWAGAIAGLAFMLFPEETGIIVAKVGDAVGSMVEAVVDVVASALGGAASGLLKSPLVLVAGGLALWWFLGKDDKVSDPVVIDSQSTSLLGQEEIYVP